MVHGVAKSRTRLKRYSQSAFIQHLILEIFFKVKICDHNPNIYKTKQFNNYGKTLKLKTEIAMEK